MAALSVVVPCFNEIDNLAELHRRVSVACRAVVGEDYEIVLVNDGSSDGSGEAIERLSRTDPHIKGVNLMRNHGHQLAATAGLAMSVGARVMLIDADLQDPPELLADMMALMDQGADVVYGKRRSRAGEGRFKTLTAAAFYRLLSRLAQVPIPRDTGDFRLMRRRIVDALLLMPERARFIRGLVSWIGGRQEPLLYERQARHAGVTKYPLGRMLRFAANALTSFSTVPLRAAVWLGLAIAGLAGILLVYTIVEWANHRVVDGWSSLMTAVSLFAGVQLVVLGIIGEYLGLVVDEAKRRPLYLIDSILLHGRHYAVPPDLSRLEQAGRERVVAQCGLAGETEAAEPALRRVRVGAGGAD